MHYHWNWSIFWQMTPEGTGTYLHTLLVGLVWTLATGLAAWVIALVLGSILGVMRTMPGRWAAAIGNVYVDVFRNIPLLVQMFLWFFVLLPMTFRIILPPLTSEFLNIIKNSSVALTIGVVELTAAARAMQEFSFQVFEAFAAATVIYLITNLIVVLLMRALEKRVRVPGFIGAAPGGGGH